MDGKAQRIRMLAAAAGLELEETELADLADPLGNLIDSVDEACATFPVDAPAPLMCPRPHLWEKEQ